VAGMGAADAAFGFSSVPLPPPPAGAVADVELPPPAPIDGRDAAGAPTGVRLVTDAELAELATTEFAPPAGVDPWLGRVLLNEHFDQAAVAAWVSAHAARDVLTVTETDSGKVRLGMGPKFDAAPPEEQAVLRRMLGGKPEIELGTYSKSFATEWANIAKRQRQFVNASGFWKRPLGVGGGATTATAGLVAVGALVAVFVARAALRSS